MVIYVKVFQSGRILAVMEEPSVMHNFQLEPKVIDFVFKVNVTTQCVCECV